MMKRREKECDAIERKQKAKEHPEIRKTAAESERTAAGGCSHSDTGREEAREGEERERVKGESSGERRSRKDTRSKEGDSDRESKSWRARKAARKRKIMK